MTGSTFTASSRAKRGRCSYAVTRSATWSSCGPTPSWATSRPSSAAGASGASTRSTNAESAAPSPPSRRSCGGGSMSHERSVRPSVDDLVLEIGGVRVAVTAREAELHARLRARYAAFLTERPADWTVTATVAASVARLGRQARAERTADGSVRFERSDFRGAVDLVARRAEVELMDTEEYSFDTFLRMMLSLVLDESDGLLVHAASLARDGRGYLFPGVSGAGKTRSEEHTSELQSHSFISY